MRVWGIAKDAQRVRAVGICDEGWHQLCGKRAGGHPHGNHMAITWQSHGNHMAIIWQSYGNHMLITWQSHGNHVAITRVPQPKRTESV